MGIGLSSAHYRRAEVARLEVREATAAVKATWDQLRGQDPDFLRDVVGLIGTEQLPWINQRFDSALRVGAAGGGG